MPKAVHADPDSTPAHTTTWRNEESVEEYLNELRKRARLVSDLSDAFSQATLTHPSPDAWLALSDLTRDMADRVEELVDHLPGTFLTWHPSASPLGRLDSCNGGAR